MKAMAFEGANVKLGAPKNWDPERDGECFELPCRRIVLLKDVKQPLSQENYAGQMHLSVWKPTDEELARLNAGECLVLSVFGGMPPVALGVGSVNGINPVGSTE